MTYALQPFWPTGSGCGRGFLGAFDAVWMLKRFCAGTSPLELVEEREALFYLLPQTTPERLSKNLTGYTIDPKTRYPNLSKGCHSMHDNYMHDIMHDMHAMYGHVDSTCLVQTNYNIINKLCKPWTDLSPV